MTSSLLPEIESIYRRRGADFFRFALARTGDVEVARDAVQEGFAAAIRGAGSFRRTGSLEAWIARCVINAAHDEVRRQTRRSSNTTDAAALNGRWTRSESATGDESLGVRDAVRQLPSRQRDALFLRFYLGLDYAAIGEVLGVRVGTVSATLHAARDALARTIQREEDHDLQR